MSKSLPPRPNLEQLKNQAKDLRKSHQSGDPVAVRRIQQSHPDYRNRSAKETQAARLSLAEAQLVIAREYGFPGWPQLKSHVDSLLIEAGDPLELVHQAFLNDDAGLVRKLLERHPALKARINEPIGPFDSPAITNVRSRRMFDVLQEAGADINAKSRWWAGGFGLLHCADPGLATYAIECGAAVDVHAAARLGLVDRLRDLIAADPELVRARGGDGQTPLHFASTLEVAEFLVDHGAELDARDVDHESTPAQYMTDKRHEIARCLVRRGCKTDLLLASAIGDVALVRQHLDADPDCIRMRVSDEYFPMIHPRGGGTIYQWTLGWHVSAHDVAKKFGHEDVLRLLTERSPADVQLLAACWAGDDSTVKRLLAEQPGIAEGLSAASQRQIAHAARNNNLTAVRLMIEAGLPVDARSQHNATPLHWAAWHGNAGMVRALLKRNPPLEDAQNDFQATPLKWAIHGSENGWHRQNGNYPDTVEQLIKAGAKLPAKADGTDAVKSVLRRHGVEG